MKHNIRSEDFILHDGHHGFKCSCGKSAFGFETKKEARYQAAQHVGKELINDALKRSE